MSLSSIIIDRIRIRYAAVLFEVANLADWLKWRAQFRSHRGCRGGGLID
jgi:hypothetical protein